MTTLNAPAKVLTAEEITAAVDEYLLIESAVNVSVRRLGELKASIRSSMLAENATRFPHPNADVSITPGRKVYDLDRVRAKLGEKLLEAGEKKLLDKLAPIEPVECKPCQGAGVVSPKVSGTVANQVRRMGDEYVHLLDQCIATQGDPELTIEPKGGKS